MSVKKPKRTYKAKPGTTAKPKVPAKKKTGSLVKKTIWAMAVVALVSAAVLWASLFKDYPVTADKQKLSITHGDTYSGLIDKLSKENKVHFPLVLKLYQKLVIHDTLKAGVYEIQKGMSVRQVLELISNAENAQMNRILVIEGTTFKQLIESLRHDPLVTKTIVHLPQKQILQQLNIPYDHPEGLFAPDTYFFDKGATDKKILTELYQRQKQYLDQAWANKDEGLPYKDPYQALIMASIIEKETSLDSELEQVAGVFIRRLQQGMRLQTDPTVIYGMGERYKGNISKQDLRTPTPYNTYTMNGLPPTPIALPGKKAIEAAMHPDHSNNVYFVATGNGGHKFSATLEEHNRAVQSYLAVMQAKHKEQ